MTVAATRARSASVVAGLLPAILALLFFAFLTFEVRRGDTAAFDNNIRAAVHAHATPARTGLMRGISRVGEPALLIDTGAAVIVLLLIFRRWRIALLVLTSLIGSELLDQALKFSIRRPRPPVFFGLRQPLGYSFPSGHSLVSCAVFGAIAVFAASRIRNRTVRWLCYLALAIPVFAIGFSRVYLGMHYPTDVLGGYAAAIVWLTLVELMFRGKRR